MPPLPSPTVDTRFFAWFFATRFSHSAECNTMQHTHLWHSILCHEDHWSSCDSNVKLIALNVQSSLHLMCTALRSLDNSPACWLNFNSTIFTLAVPSTGLFLFETQIFFLSIFLSADNVFENCQRVGEDVGEFSALVLGVWVLKTSVFRRIRCEIHDCVITPRLGGHSPEILPFINLYVSTRNDLHYGSYPQNSE